MGFFSWLSDKVWEAKITVEIAVENAIDKLKDVLGMDHYDSDSVPSRVNVEKVLQNFRERIMNEAGNVEKVSIEKAMKQFDHLIDSLESRFPDLVYLAKKQQEQARKELTGVIMSYVQIYMSENNPAFEAVLKMQPGFQKSNALKQKSAEIIENAEKEFTGKLKTTLCSLIYELERRLDVKICYQENELEKKMLAYKKISEKVQAGDINLEYLEQKATPSIEASRCIMYLFEHQEN